MLNVITMSGRLTQSPTLQIKKTDDKEIKFLRFSIACQRNYKEPDGSYGCDFFDCIAWRGTAELISNHFEKGQELIIKGELKTSIYTDKDNNKRKSVFINVEQVYFAGAKKSSTAVPTEKIPIPDDDAAPPLDVYLDDEN